MARTRRPVVAGALALMASGAVSRVIGAVYRIALVRTAGEEVLGLFQMTMPLYRLLIDVAAIGFHVALVQLVADSLGRRRVDDAKGYIRFALVTVTALSCLLATLLWFTGPTLAHTLYGDPRLETPLRCLGLLLLPAAICAIVRGSIQGWGHVSTVAIAGTTEAALRVPAVLVMLSLFLPWGQGPAATAILLGMVVGEFGSLVVLGTRLRSLLHSTSSQKGVLLSLRYGSTLLAIGLPVMISGLLNNAMGLINTAMIPKQLLISGLSQSEATAAFGTLSGMVTPILFMPLVLVGPISQVMIPAVAERMAQNQWEKVKQLLIKGFSVAVVVSAVTSVVFWFFPEQLGQILYGAPHIADLVRPLAFAAPFVFCGLLAASTLYGLGRMGTVMVNTFVGNTARFLIILKLVSDPHWGILGAAWALGRYRPLPVP